MKEFNMIGKIAFIAVLAGGIDLGLFGLFNADILAAIFGGLLSRLAYIAVGVAAGYLIYDLYLKDRLPARFRKAQDK